MKKSVRIISNLIKFRTPYLHCTSRKFGLSTLKPPWNVLFFGTDEFALESLKMLYLEMNTQHLIKDLSVVCAQFKCPVAKYSLKNNLKILQWKPSLEDINQTEAHIGIVTSFGHLIPAKIIQAFPMGMLNVHASILPRWRGAAPVVHAVLNRDKVTGVTIMKIKPHKFDVGEILGSASCKIGTDETAYLLTQRLALLGAQELKKTLQTLPQCLIKAKSQPSSGVTLAPKIEASMSACKWNSSNSNEIYAQYLALNHLYPLYATWQGQPIRILDCEVTEKCPGKPGDIKFDYQNKRLLVVCHNNTSIGIKHLRILGKCKISALDFSNGYLKKVSKELWRFGPGLVT